MSQIKFVMPLNNASPESRRAAFEVGVNRLEFLVGALSQLEHCLLTSAGDKNKASPPTWYKEGIVDKNLFFGSHPFSDAAKKLGEKILAMTSQAPPAS